MSEVTRKLSWPGGADAADILLTREWLVTNGLGGYASGTVADLITRRFHGYLIAALPAPLGRMMISGRVADLPGWQKSAASSPSIK
jgi:hypothetical protein